MNKRGKVILIGGGPGDPDLLTIKGKRCIKKADVIVYDYLVNERLLNYAREDAEVIYVGKKGGEHTLPQEKINDLIVDKAKEGKIVARLKGGDPFVFGRGGEEAEILADHGVDFEIVPGVTAAIAVPAYAGIPLTHRDFTSTVTFITGHEDPSKERSSIAWDKISTGAGSLIFLMGVKNLHNIVENLINNGRGPETPVAIVRWGTTKYQETVVGRLNNIIDLAKEKKILPPAIIIIGDVVRLREKLNWFEDRPLLGKKIIVTRAQAQASDFSTLLEGYGAIPIEFPTIETIPPESWDGFDNAIEGLDGYDWIIFTSVNGVRSFLKRLPLKNKDIRDLKGIRICTIGPKTAKEIERLGIGIDFVPPEYRAETIVEGLKERGIKGKRALLPRAAEARDLLPIELREMGVELEVVEAYRTVKPLEKTNEIRRALKEGEIDVITFTSSSTVSNFVEMFGKEDFPKLINGVVIASIGPVTAKRGEEFGLISDIIPKEYTIEALAEAINEYFIRR
ncbi:MAG: uroporphyrinogen-III C-methyltransferase [Nitrospinae bacterium]|nr:uroporphyrinogen-III C-methyltransferase [Nitrospinota bacterium]